jgi:three-Cys-motif partner protein
MKESQINLFEHSDAKVALYEKYLSIYLNVISRSYVENIYLFDLFCGEGINADSGKGSPIAALECIKRHYFSNNKSCPNLFITFNDIGHSEIENGTLKTERVKKFADDIFRPSNVKVGYTNIDYKILIKLLLERISKLENNERALIFIDPWGYKEINPIDLKKLLEDRKTEVLLFLPIYFMSRFAEKSKDLNFHGGKPLRQFLEELFGSIDQIPKFKNQLDFIEKLRLQFKAYLGTKYVDTFKIEREKNLWFTLFFFTNNEKGFLKMLESKWSLDKQNGEGFRIGNNVQVHMFEDITETGYIDKVLSLLESNPDNTNMDLFEFGLENNFLPKHTKKALDRIKEKHEIEVVSLDGKKAMSYYLANKSRLVNIKLK